MKKLLMSILVLVSSAQYVQAYDGRISFTGSFVDTPSDEKLDEFMTQVHDLKKSIENNVTNKSIGSNDMIPALKKWSNNKKNYRNYTWIEKIEVKEIELNTAIISVNYI